MNRRLASRERANSRGDATRLDLLTTAEQLFAEHGIAAVPLRDIGIAAGQKNHAAVQYHFGDRDSLVAEIIAYRAELSEQLRVEMFADLASRGQPQVGDLVRVFVLPLAAHLEEQSHYLAFMSRYITEHGGYRGLNSSMGIPSETVSTLRSLLGRLLPDHPARVLDERWMVLMTSTIHTLARYQAVAVSGGDLGAPIDALLEDLVSFLTAGLSAPVSLPSVWGTGQGRADRREGGDQVADGRPAGHRGGECLDVVDPSSSLRGMGVVRGRISKPERSDSRPDRC